MLTIYPYPPLADKDFKKDMDLHTGLHENLNFFRGNSEGKGKCNEKIGTQNFAGPLKYA